MSDCSFWANIGSTAQVARTSTATTRARLSRRRNKVWAGWKVKRPAPSKSTRGRIIELADPTPLLPRRAIETSAQVGRIVSHVAANHVNIAILYRGVHSAFPMPLRLLRIPFPQLLQSIIIPIMNHYSNYDSDTQFRWRKYTLLERCGTTPPRCRPLK